MSVNTEAKVDPAILRSLSLNPATTDIATHGHSGFSSTFKITSTDEDGLKKSFFVKTGRGKDSEIMFAGEHASLNAIHSVVPSLCPESHAHGSLENTPNGYFLMTDFLDLSSSKSTRLGSGVSLARKMAELHSTPAPVPDGCAQAVFGFPIPTCCGKTVQDNTYNSSWASFYAHNRLIGILATAEKAQGQDPELSTLVSTTVSKVVPALLSEGHLTSPDGSPIVPVVVHGDLWSGNHGRASIGESGVEEVVFDSSASWSHSEFEFGIMRMFGGFGKQFEKEYFDIKGRDEPVEEWGDRVMLYELYHHLNHFAMFGGGYRGGAVNIMRKLIQNYGSEL